jgi:hypothetical protein
MSASGCSIQNLAELQPPGTRRQMAGEESPEEDGRWLTVMAEIVISVDIIV